MLRRVNWQASVLIGVLAVFLSGCTDPRIAICVLTGGQPVILTGIKQAVICRRDASRAAAASAGETLLIGATAHVAGALGTNWRSDVEVHSLSDEPAAVTVWLLRHNTVNDSPQSVQLVVQPGQCLRLGDVLADRFGVTGKAALMLSVTAGRVLATSRTYNLLEAGNPLGLPAGSTFGQYIPALAEAEAIRFGDEGRLIQLSHSTASDGGFRTNLGLVNGTGFTIQVEVDLYAADGSLHGSLDMTLPSFGYRQLDRVFATVTAGEVADGYAVVRTTTAGGQLYAYASVVDNLTGDPVAISAVRVPVVEPPGAGDPVWVVAAAHLSGVGGTNWRTDLEVHCWGDVMAAYTIELLEHGKDNSTPAYSRAYTLAPGASVRLEDILASEFGLSGAAAIRITPTAGHVVVTSRTFNLLTEGNAAGLPAGATFGQYIPGELAEDAIRHGEEGRLIQLSHTPGGASGFRTNLVLVNATAQQIEVEVDLFGANGVLLGTTKRTLEPYEYRQLNAVYALVTASVVEDGYAVVRTTTPGGAVFALASVVDNLTGDPVGQGAAVVMSAGAEGFTSEVGGALEVLGDTSIGDSVDWIQQVGVDGVLDAFVSSSPTTTSRTSDGVVIDYGEDWPAPDGTVRSGKVTVDASGLDISSDMINGTIVVSHEAFTIDDEPPQVGPTAWTIDLEERQDGTVAGEIEVRPAGATATSVASAHGDLSGTIQIDSALCHLYPVGGSLTLNLGDEVLRIVFTDRCDGGVESSTGPPPVEPEGNLLALEWSFTGGSSTVGTIDSETGAWQTIGSSGFPRLNSLAKSPSGVYYSVTEYDTCGASRLITIDAGTGAGSVVGPLTGMPDHNYVPSLAFDAAGNLFATVGECNPGTAPDDELYRIDPGSGAATKIGDIEGFQGVGALHFDDATGTLYGWDYQVGLITVNPTTGAATDINGAVVGPSMQALAVLPNGAMVGGQHALYSIDKATGEATQIGAANLNNVRGIEVLEEQ